MISIDLQNINLEIPIFNNERIRLKEKKFLYKLGGVFKTSNNNTLQAIKALNNISLKLKNGDRLGLIGPNGAGKTTLLRLLAGIYKPTSGLIDIRGKICSILDSSLGMNDELTGIENLKLMGMYYGLKKSVINKSIEELIKFTDLGEFIYLPVKRYSSGMVTRLGFAITRIIKSEILLVDEAIGTGDINFTKKVKKNNNILQKSEIIILASHNIELMKEFCNKAVFLNRGKIVHEGKVLECFDKYRMTFDKNALPSVGIS